MAFGQLSYYDDPFYRPEVDLPDVGAPLIPSGPTTPGKKAWNRLFGTGGETRFQTWPEATVRRGVSLAGDLLSGQIGMLQPGLRREDYTDIPAPSAPTKDSTWLGRTLNIAPVGAQPNDAVMEQAQDMAGLAGGGLVFGRMAQPAAVAPALKPVVAMADSQSHGAPLAALEQGKALAVERRNKGWNTGKMAQGHDFKRPDPEPGSFDALAAEARARYAAQRTEPDSPLLTEADKKFIADGWFYEDAALPGAPIAALEKVRAPAIMKTKLVDEQGLPIQGPAYSKEARAVLEDIERGPKGAGPMDISLQARVPDVPQVDLPRYVPPRGVSPRLQEALESPTVQQGLRESMEAGRGVANWYHTDPIRVEFIKELGPAKGQTEFKRFMDTVAATSPRSDVPTNVRNASYYYQRGTPDNLPAKNPYPYGHVAQNLHRQNFETISGAGGWDPFQNPKPASFAENLRGNLEPVTVDTHAFRNIGMRTDDPRFLATQIQEKLPPGVERGPNSKVARFGEIDEAKGVVRYRPQQLIKEGRLTMEEAKQIPSFWDAMPKANEYAAAETMFKRAGDDLGLRPADAQAAAWAGGGDLTGLGTVGTHTFPELMNERVEFTARMRGEDPKKTLSDFIRGKATLLEDAAPAGVTVAAMEAIGRKTREGTYYEVLKNPKKSDLLKLGKDYPTMGRSAPQMRVMKVGENTYAWPAAYATHDQIAKSLGLKHPGFDNLDNLEVTPRGLAGGKKDWNSLFEDATPAGAPIAALERQRVPNKVNWQEIDAAERSLPPAAARALDSWVGGDVDTLANVKAGKHAGWGVFDRAALEKNPVVTQELRKAFQPLRDQLKAEHGDTVTLYRYHGKIPEEAKPHDILSFTNDRSIAEGLSGAEKLRPIVPEEQIAAMEREFEQTGRVQVDKNTTLERTTGLGLDGQPQEYIAIMRGGEEITDSGGVREYINEENAWNAKMNKERRDDRLANIKSYEIPVDDIIAATNRFGQQEFVVKNSRGLFEDATPAGAPIAALEHSATAKPYMDLLDQPPAQAYKPADVTEAATAREAAAPARGDGPGGAGGGDERLSQAAREAERRAGAETPLEGLPRKAMKIGDEYFVPGPIETVRKVAADYMANRDTPSYHKPPTKYHPLDEEHSRAIAKAFDEMKHDPDNPAVKNSYDALINETIAQYKAIEKTGLKIEPIEPGMPDPYAANPRLAAKDVADNNHLWYFPTDAGFGSNPAAGIDMAKHPMMRKTGVKLGDRELLANDLFRIVHDYFGHLKEGYGFRAAGEDNAWRSHASMYSDLARPAMTTETRGQNSWVNYGPHGEKNRKASAADTVYADQKVGLMPEWTMRDRGSPEPTIAYHGTPYSFDKFDPSKIGAGEGNQAFGHGLYFAGAEPVSEWYRHQLASRRDPLLEKYGLTSQDGADIGISVAGRNGDAKSVIADLKAYVAELKAEGRTDKATKNMIARAEGKIEYLKDPNRSKGHMYQVAIDAAPEQFLDWDAPVRPEQLDAVRQAASDIRPGVFDRLMGQGKDLAKWSLTDPEYSTKPRTGEVLYGTLRRGFGSDAAASAALKKAGFPGIRYKDAMSRGKDAGTANYVTFDAPRMLRKYATGYPTFGSMGRPEEDR